MLALGAIFGMVGVGLDVQAMELKRKDLVNVWRTHSLVRGHSYISCFFIMENKEEWLHFNNCIIQPWASEDEETREDHP